MSFSVDPLTDTPEVLSEYADSFGADPRRWLFLTGERDELYTLIHDGFKLAGAAEEDGRGIGHIRLRRIANASAASLGAFVEEAIEPGSLVHTDGWEGYAGLEKKGYRHEVTVLRGKRQSAS